MASPFFLFYVKAMVRLSHLLQLSRLENHTQGNKNFFKTQQIWKIFLNSLHGLFFLKRQLRFALKRLMTVPVPLYHIYHHVSNTTGKVYKYFKDCFFFLWIFFSTALSLLNEKKNCTYIRIMSQNANYMCIDTLSPSNYSFLLPSSLVFHLSPHMKNMWSSVTSIT